MTTEAAGRTLPAFALDSMAGQLRAFPTGRHTLLAFVKEDCPTCILTMPLLAQTERDFGDRLDVLIVGQEAAGNLRLAEQFQTAPLLDDTPLYVSYAYDLDTVPAIFLAAPDGRVLREFVGFQRGDWQTLWAELARLAGCETPAVDWDSYPQLRPGCGSRSVEPGIAERLEAEASGSRLRARRIEIPPAEDAIEFLYEQGLTDGMPVVPPTPERVLRMLTGTRRDPQEVVAIVPPNLAPATVEKVAINAVMAGCRPEYLPVVLAALEAVCTDEFNIHGVNATTWSSSTILVVNGPIRQRIGMNMGLNALGHGNRANSTIGRALKLVLRNVGGAKPGGVERSALGSPGKYGVCFAEYEERSPWEPLHVERGFRPEQSVVTVFGIEGAPRGIGDQLSRTASQLAGSLGLAIEAAFHPKLHGQGDMLLVVCPEHVDTLHRDGWSKDQIRARVQEVTARPVRELLTNDVSGEGIPPSRFGPNGPSEEELNRTIPKFRDPKTLHIVVAGGEAGKFSAIFGGWVGGAQGSIPVSRLIEE
jgi:hypothetical protein